MSEEPIRLTGKTVYPYLTTKSDGCFDQATIELEPPDLSKLKDGDIVLAKGKIRENNVQKLRILDCPFDDVVAILPKEKETESLWCSCKSPLLQGGWRIVPGNEMGNSTSKTFPLCYNCNKVYCKKEQPKEMPEVPFPFMTEMGLPEFDIKWNVNKLIGCVKDLQERIIKMEDKANETK